MVAASSGCRGEVGVAVPTAEVQVSGPGVHAEVTGPKVEANVGVGVTTTPPPATTVVVASVTGPATPVAPASASFADPLLSAMAVVDAKGFQPDGSAFAGQFQQGQTLDQTFNAVPGKCYVAFGVGQGITQLDIIASTVSPSPMIPSVTVATSNSTGPQASIGGGGACVKYPLPVGGPVQDHPPRHQRLGHRRRSRLLQVVARSSVCSGENARGPFFAEEESPRCSFCSIIFGP